MTTPIPPNNWAPGDPLHILYHNWISNALTALFGGSTGLAPSGDTTGAADTAAAQARIGSTGYLRLGTGTFDFNATLNPTNTVTVIEGNGWGTILRWDGTVVSPFIGMGDTTQRTVVIKNLRIANKGASAAGTAVNADYFTSQSVISGVKIDGTSFHPNTGIVFGVVSTNTHYCSVENCRIQVDGTNAAGLKFLGGATGAISNVVRNVRILISASDVTQTGVIVATRGILLDHLDIEGGAGIAVDIQAGGDACTLISPYLESNGTNLKLASGVVAATVLGGTIITGVSADITDGGAVAPKIFGVRFTGGVSYDQMVLNQSASAGKILYVQNTAATPSDAALRVDCVNGQQAMAVRVALDGASRWRVTSAGVHDWGSGSTTPDCHLSRQAAGIMQFTNCDLDIATAGQGLRIKEDVTAGKMGTATLNSGTNVVVSTTAVTAASRIFLTNNAAAGAAVGTPIVVTRTAGTSFTIKSTGATDTSTVAWLLIEPG